jgi:hypothetical protein
MYAALRFSSKNWANEMGMPERFHCFIVADVGLFTLNVLA